MTTMDDENCITINRWTRLHDTKKQFSQPYPNFSLPEVNGEPFNNPQEQFYARNVDTNRAIKSKEHPIRYCFGFAFAAVIAFILSYSQRDLKKAENFLLQQKKASILNDPTLAKKNASILNDPTLANRIDEVLNDTHIISSGDFNSSNQG